MSTLICLPPTGISSSLSAWILWGIWLTRNALLFENRTTSAKTMVIRSTQAAREWIQAQASIAGKVSPPSFEQEQPSPPSSIFLCNTDGAWTTSRHAGLGWHFDSTSHGRFLEGSREIEHVSSPLMAEALAMREAMQVAQRNSFIYVWFRTDSQELFRAFFSVSFVGLHRNVIADSLAKSVLQNLISSL